MFGWVGCALIFTGLILSMTLDPEMAKEVEFNG
jgi:hypothetical protein